MNSSEVSMEETWQLLEDAARRYNVAEFIPNDPVQFPRKMASVADIEITALLCSAISWGNRRSIIKDCDKMLAMMDNRPYDFMMERGYEDLPPELNIHRTFFVRNLANMLRGLREIYKRCGTMGDFVRRNGIHNSSFPAWEIAKSINESLLQASGKYDSRCIPANIESSALKRLNMALRWMVRNDGIVDMGVWDFMKPSQLFIPLDVHVGNVSRELGLLDRKANDRRSTILLTDRLRSRRPDDPVWFDFALFGIGLSESGGRLLESSSHQT